MCRPISGPSGGQCGLAALYLALSSTLLTQSQLKLHTYSSMRQVVAQEILLADSDLALINDVQLLDKFYTCEYGTII